jgi:glycosyltransferase involved in cell wall biosynthesis
LSPHGGRSLTEACLAGVPIIAYDFEWQRELIKNNQTGFLIKNHNWRGFVEKIIYILRNKKKSKLLGRNARVLALKMMNPKKLERHEKLQYAKTIENYNLKYV